MLNKDRAFLLVVDIQERLAKVMDREDEVVDNTNVLVEAAKTFDMPIVVTEQYPRGLGNTVEEISKNFDEETAIFDKISFSLYLDDIKEHIDSLDRKQVIITGMETHICVYQSAVDLAKAGYDVYIARDACCSRDDENRENGFELIKDIGDGVISNTETILYELLEVAGTEEFKKLSKLIK